MQQPAPSVRRASHLKLIVCLLGALCTVALCFPSATRLIAYYQAASTVKVFPFGYPDYSYNQHLYSPDLSRTLAFDSTTGKGIIWDYATQRITHHIDFGHAQYPELAWSPDQHYLLYARTLPNYRDILDLWDLARQKKVFSVIGDYPLTFQSAIWSPDNTRIALLYNNELTFIDAVTGRVLAYHQPTIDDKMFADTAAWSPDGKLIALANNSIKETSPGHYIYTAWVNVMNTSTRHIVSEALRPTTAAEITNMHLAWSPDGKSIAVSFGQQFWILNPYDGTKARRFNDQYSSLSNAVPLAWSPDSTRLAVFGDLSNKITDKELAIWSIADLQKVQVVEQGDLSSAINLYWPPAAQHILLIVDSGSQETLPLSI